MEPTTAPTIAPTITPTAPTPQTQPDQPKRFQCRHIFTDGRRCGSASLRNEHFCYYHHTTRPPAANPGARKARRGAFALPLPEDRSAIQASIGQVLQRIASNDLDPRRAGLLLYGLQIAALNLPKEQPILRPEDERPHEAIVEQIELHPDLGPLAPQAEAPHPRRLTRQQLLDWALSDNKRMEERLKQKEGELRKRESVVRALEPPPPPPPPRELQWWEKPKTAPAPKPAVLPEIKAVAADTPCRATNAQVPHPSRTCDGWESTPSTSQQLSSFRAAGGSAFAFPLAVLLKGTGLPCRTCCI